MTDWAPRDPHLEAGLVAGYVDGHLGTTDAATVEAHLAECADCRQEVIDVRRLVGRPGRRVPWSVVLPIAAVACLLLLIWPKQNGFPLHRGGNAPAQNAPIALRPVGSVVAVDTLSWSQVAGIDRYRVTLFDSLGTVLWQEQTRDSVVALPVAIHLQPLTTYYWKVEARVGWDHWTSSQLAQFRLFERAPPQ